MIFSNPFRVAVLTLAMVCFGHTSVFGDQSVSCTISPLDADNTTCQTITLNSEETGSFSVNIDTPSDYILVGVVDGEPDGDNPDFLWINVGPETNSVVNTAWTAGSTTVRVTATWKKTTDDGGGGGGGGGDGLIVRWAQDTAIAQEGTLIVTAEPELLPVMTSDGSLAQAFRSELSGLYPANASWTVDDPAYIVGATFGENVTVQSDKAGTYEVCATTASPPPHSGSALVTFFDVTVTSIEADPDVVCVGEEVSYTITTDPAGYETLVSYTPADTSTPGIKEVIATCGTSSATCTVTVLKVDTAGDEFVKKYADESAPNITMTATPSLGGGTYSWSIVQGAGKVAFVGSTSASTATIKGKQASAANGDVHVEVAYTIGGTTCTDIHELTVQKPTTITHGPLTFILNQVAILGIPISFAVGAQQFIGTLSDQLGNTMADVPFSETVSIDKPNSIPDSGYLTFAVTGSGSTSGSGQYTDVYMIPALGEAPDNMNIKVEQIVFFGGYKGVNNVILTKTNVSDSYPITLAAP